MLYSTSNIGQKSRKKVRKAMYRNKKRAEVDETEKLTLELTKEQLEFLRWVSDLEGITPQEYLLRFTKGKLIKSQHEN
jgi:hypothetical protein